MWIFPQREAEHDGASKALPFVATGDDMESMAESSRGSRKKVAVDKVKAGKQGPELLPPALARHSLISQDLMGVGVGVSLRELK